MCFVNDFRFSMSYFQKLKEERDEKIAQSRILELLKEEEATKDLLAFFEDRKKQGLSLLPSLGEEDFSENTIDVEDVDQFPFLTVFN